MVGYRDRNRIMNWYFAQKQNLATDIARFLISIYNREGNYTTFFNKIISQMIDNTILENSILEGIAVAIKVLRIEALTPEMQGAVRNIMMAFNGHFQIPSLEQQNISPNLEDNLVEPMMEEPARPVEQEIV